MARARRTPGSHSYLASSIRVRTATRPGYSSAVVALVVVVALTVGRVFRILVFLIFLLLVVLVVGMGIGVLFIVKRNYIGPTAGDALETR